SEPIGGGTVPVGDPCALSALRFAGGEDIDGSKSPTLPLPMNRHEQKQLLTEILVGDELCDFRKASLERGLKALRRRRFRRQALQACWSACLLLWVVCGFWYSKAPAPVQKRAKSGEPRSLGVAAADEGRIKVLSDEELFALFPNRPMALVGKPGHQELVFLDQKANNVKD